MPQPSMSASMRTCARDAAAMLLTSRVLEGHLFDGGLFVQPWPNRLRRPDGLNKPCAAAQSSNVSVVQVPCNMSNMSSQINSCLGTDLRVLA
jgi:hypothetical protein